jgi:hypothetical protein
MIHSSSFFSICAPIAFMAAPVRITSSPSSRPVMRVSPEARPPNMKERWEIDLSPGTRTRPESGGDRLAVAGFGLASCAIVQCPGCVWPSENSKPGGRFCEVFLTCARPGVIPEMAAKPAFDKARIRL